MKKLIVSFLVLALVLGIGFALYVQRKLALVDVAELLPGDTVMLVHLPDVPRSRERWKATALAQIVNEPEVAAFLERPKSKAPHLAGFQSRVNRVLATEPREGFVAVTSLAGAHNLPKVVAGLSYAGKREDVEALLAGAKKRLQAANPTGKSDLLTHQGANVETFTTDTFFVGMAFVKQWCFIADDLDLLKATLDGFSGTKNPNSLRKNKNFASSLVRMAQQPDATFYMQPKVLADRLATFVAATGQPANPGIEELRKIEALTATTKMEGANIRDTMFSLKAAEGEHPPMARNSLALSSSDTLLYYAAVMTLSGSQFKLPDPALDATGILRKVQAIGTLLQARGLSWNDAASAFGPELGVALDWPPAAPQPGLVLSMDVRDPAKARAILETLTSGGVGGVWTPQMIDQTQYFKMTTGFAFVTPAIALSDKFLLLGLSPESVRSALARAKTDTSELSKTAGFIKAAGTVNTPTKAFGYVAAKPLFERIYGTARPFMIMWSGFAPKIGEYVDVAKLPATETISRHLGPIVFSQSATKDGTMTESVGPVTFGEAMVTIGAGVGAAAVPRMLSGGGLPTTPPPNAPSSGSNAPNPDATEVVVPGAAAPSPSSSPGL